MDPELPIPRIRTLEEEMARSIAERRREVAIRMALGASRGAVTSMILKRAAALTSAGLAAGVAGTVVVASGLESLLFGVAPHDPATIAAVVLFVAAASLAAAWLPARRAGSVEPWELLRSE